MKSDEPKGTDGFRLPLLPLRDIIVFYADMKTANEAYAFFEKITNGFYGLKVLPNLINLDEKRHPIVTSSYRAVIQNEDFDKIAETLQLQLARN